MAAVDIAAAQLAADAVGTLGTNMFRGAEFQPSPAAQTVLAEYPGMPSAYVFGQASPSHEFLGLHVETRDSDPDAAKAKAWAVYASLTKVGNTTLAGNRVLAIMPKQAPFYLRTDENKNVIWACNYTVWREGASS